jgi:predicted tellurium resistance membrane protein TerC
VLEGEFNFHAIIVLIGGAFIMYTATKEIWHMMQVRDLGHEDRKPRSVARVIFWIVAMNLVFSFDSILSAIALTDVFWVMATSIFIGAMLMIWLSDGVAAFLEKNRMYEVLGLFILLVVGIMLLSEGGHLAHLQLFGNPIDPMTKTTFYFVIAILVLTDIVQSRYRKKLLAQRAAAEGATA